MSNSKTTMVAVDGTDALAYVIIRPNPSNPTNPIVVEAAANGLSHQAAAYVLRHVADQFDPATASDRTRPASVVAEMPGQLSLFEDATL